jgi:methyl-galactoside transport system substrate-binding protein
MKKLLFFALLILGAAYFAGCEASKFQVDVFFYDFSDTYIGSVRTSMETQLKAASDKFSYTFYDGKSDQAIQTNQVETAITKGSSLLIVNIVTTGSEEAAQNIVDKAKEKNIPVIFFNREVSDDVVKSYDKCVFVGTDADEAGYMQGQMIAEFLLETGNLAKYDLDDDKKIDYVMFRGELGNAEAFGRTKYSVLKANELLTSSGYSLAPSPANQNDSSQPADGISPYYLYGNWSAATAKNLMDTALTTYNLTSGDIELVIANNDDQALGAIEAMNEVNYNTGDDNDGYIPTFGVDATAVAVDAISNDKMTGTIKQDAVGMATGILTLAGNLQAGEDYDFTNFNKDTDVNKIRIPYAIYTGE